MAMIDTFRNRLYKSKLKDSATGFRTPTGLYVGVFRDFCFQNKNSHLPLEIDFDGFKLTGHVSKFRTGIEITIDNTPLNDRGYIGHYILSAVNDRIPGSRTWRDIVQSSYENSTTVFRCPDLLEESKGCVNRKGVFRIKFQINLVLAANLLKAYQLTRVFRLDSFVTGKDAIEDMFAQSVDSARKKLAGIEQVPAWDSFYSRKELWQINEDQFLHMLWVVLGGHMILFDVVWTGSVKYLFDLLKDPPEELVVFVKRNHGRFSVKGPIDSMLRKVEGLTHSTLSMPEEEKLDFAGIESFERDILMKGCVIFQSIYVALAWNLIRLSIDASLLPPEAHVSDMLPPEARVADMLPPEARVADLDLEADISTVEEPLSHAEAAYLKALEEYETGHTECLNRVEDIGNEYRLKFKDVYVSQPPNQYRPKLREAKSQYHSKAQNIASFYFREDENLQKDELTDFYTWKYIPNKEEKEQRSRSRSKQAAEEVGYTGEKYVFGYLKDIYQDDNRIEVKWCNEARESGLPYDLTVWNATKEKLSYVEVKSSSVSGRDYFFLTPRELNWARNYKGRYIVIYVSVDLSKKPPNEQCSVIKVYKDPANHPHLRLSMVDVSKFISK